VCVVERMGDDSHFVILAYIARVIGGALDPGSDVTGARWCDEAALAELPLTDGLLPILERARATHARW